MTRKFATRRLVLTFKPSSEQKKDLLRVRQAVTAAVYSVFGSVQMVNGYMAYLYMSESNDVYDLRDTLWRELRKHECLKGMKFKIELNSEPWVV